MVGEIRLQQTARGFDLSKALSRHIARRLQFAIGRFSARVRRVRVRLSDVNGPRGGVDMLCRLDVAVDGVDPIVITEVAEDMYAAIDNACGRAGRVVARRVQRLRDGRRRETLRGAYG